MRLHIDKTEVVILGSRHALKSSAVKHVFLLNYRRNFLFFIFAQGMLPYTPKVRLKDTDSLLLHYIEQGFLY